MKKKRIALLVSMGVVVMSLQGCVKPYNTPEFVEITPSQTAFLIPMVGDTTDQVKLDSEELLVENMVNSKRIQIPKEWIQTGRFQHQGEYKNTANLIVVERAPVTREWTETAGEGTSNSNQGIVAESSESIGFMARMYVTAQIEEKNTAKFLYEYSGKTLETIIDTDIRSTVEGKFNEICSKKVVNEIRTSKEEIMNEVREYVKSYFAEKGITVSNIALKGELTYLNPEIQESIDAEFKAQKEKDAKEIKNQEAIDTAEAERKVIETQAATLADTIRLKEAEAKLLEAEAKLKQAEAMANWDVKVLGDNPIIQGIGQ